jgi:hypothetical protein
MNTNHHAIAAKIGQLIAPDGENYLHQRRIAIISRKEDKDGVLTILSNTDTQIESRPIKAKDCEGRRQSVVIEFENEVGCGHDCDFDCDSSCNEGFYYLLIMQHKGKTFCEWISRPSYM